MKVCFVFSPFASISYVPLGIAYLKSYLEKNISGLNVTNVDLSNNFHHRLSRDDFAMRLPSLCPLCPEDKKRTCGGILKDKNYRILIKAARFANSILTDAQTNKFYDVAVYNKLVHNRESTYLQIAGCLLRILKHALQAGRRKDFALLEQLLLNDDLTTIIAKAPRVAGFSVFSESQLFYSLVLAKIVKAKMNPVIIFGGAYIAHIDSQRLLEMSPWIDFVIYKEGELGIEGVLRKLRTKTFDAVPNLVYRKRNRIIENKERVLAYLDAVPFPDFSDFDLKKYFLPAPVVLTLFSRGCYWRRCTFCAHHKTYAHAYRKRSIANLIRELKRYQKKGIQHFEFVDELISAQDLLMISTALLENKMNIYFCTRALPCDSFTPEILKTMYRAGCRMIMWGVESFSQRVLTLMNKGTNAESVVRILKDAYQARIFNFIFMIQGFPTQTEKEIIHDMHILKNNLKYVHVVGMGRFELLAGAPIFFNRKKFGIRCLKHKVILKIGIMKLFSEKIPFVCKEKIDWATITKRGWRSDGKLSYQIPPGERIHLFLHAAHRKQGEKNPKP